MWFIKTNVKNVCWCGFVDVAARCTIIFTVVLACPAEWGATLRQAVMGMGYIVSRETPVSSVAYRQDAKEPGGYLVSTTNFPPKVSQAGKPWIPVLLESPDRTRARSHRLSRRLDARNGVMGYDPYQEG